MKKYLILILVCVMFSSCRPHRKCAAYNSVTVETVENKDTSLK